MESEVSNVESLMKDCTLCPRNCGADRTQKDGACGAGAEMQVARAALHFWEEPVISGSRGSGAVFFVGCNLGCIYCQNAAISHPYRGSGTTVDNSCEPHHDWVEVGSDPIKTNTGAAEGNCQTKFLTPNRLAEKFLRLQDVQGANNINLVTAAHFVPQVAMALEMAKNRGLTIPVVYNTSSYEKVEALKLLDGLVDVYLPDFKYISPELAGKLSKAPDYPQVAAAAIDEMVRQVGEAEFADEEPFVRPSDPDADINTKALTTNPSQIDDKKGAVYEPGGPLIRKGVIVRHLLLPSHVRESEKALKFLHERYGNSIYISIMNQYTPMRGDFPADDHDLAPLSRKVTKREYSRLVDFAVNIGIENGFTQTGDTAESSFIPEWNGEGIE